MLLVLIRGLWVTNIPLATRCSATSTERVHEVISDLVPEDSYFRLNPSDSAFACELDETDQVDVNLLFHCVLYHS